MRLKRVVSAVPALPVGDIARAVEFYEAKLGFGAFHQDEASARLRRGEVEITLCRADALVR
jgi:catechol 2,3-dioxygenase-like lactoylglutathione lyase family enzyme